MQWLRRRRSPTEGAPSAPPLQFEFDEEIEEAVPTAVVATVQAADGSPWDMGFRRWNATNLETEGIMRVQNQTYSFVLKTHPLIALLRANADNLQLDIDQMPLFDKQFYKVSNDLVATCCHTIRTKILVDPAATRAPA
jgi:hypothetical protein